MAVEIWLVNLSQVLILFNISNWRYFYCFLTNVKHLRTYSSICCHWISLQAFLKSQNTAQHTWEHKMSGGSGRFLFAPKHLTPCEEGRASSRVQSFSRWTPSTQLPVLLSLESGVFRLQGFVLELVTSQLCAFLPFASIVGSKDRNVFVRVRLLFVSSVTFCLTSESSAVNSLVIFRFVQCIFLHGACDYRIVQPGVSSCLLVIRKL